MYYTTTNVILENITLNGNVVVDRTIREKQCCLFIRQSEHMNENRPTDNPCI